MLSYANSITMSNKSNKVRRVKTTGEKKWKISLPKKKVEEGQKRDI